MWFVLSASAAAPCTVAVVDTSQITCEQFLAVAGTEDSRFYYGGDLDLAERRKVVDELISDAFLLDEAGRRGVSGADAATTIALLVRKEQEAIAASPVTEADLVGWWELHHAEHDVPEKVQILHILIKSAGRGEAEAKRLAEEARAVVVAGESFQAVAKAHSEDAYARRGGDIGFVGREGKRGVDQVVVNTAFAMQEGDISPVLVTAEGAEVVSLLRRREADPFVFEEHREEVARAVRRGRLADAQPELAARLRAAAKVSIDDATLGKLVIPEPVEITEP